MSNVNRELKRKALATLLTTNLVGSAVNVNAVHNRLPPDLGGDTPVVTVSSTGTDRRNQGTKPVSAGLCWRLPLQFDVQIWVLYYVPPPDTWTDANAEDKVDAIEMAISDVVAANAHTADWEDLVYRDLTRLDYPIVGGLEYRRETIPLQMIVKVG